MISIYDIERSSWELVGFDEIECGNVTLHLDLQFFVSGWISDAAVLKMHNIFSRLGGLLCWQGRVGMHAKSAASGCGRGRRSSRNSSNHCSTIRGCWSYHNDGALFHGSSNI